jgi:hypothetical protein
VLDMTPQPLAGHDPLFEYDAANAHGFFGTFGTLGMT